VKNAHVGEGDSSFAMRDEPTKRFWREIRQIMDANYPAGFMVSEWSYPESSLDAGFHADFFHWFAGYNDLLQKESWRILNGFSEGHSFFDREGRGNIRNFLDRYLEQYAKTKDKGYILLPLGNHDVSRLNIRRTRHELEMIFAFSFAMPGIPFIYYGNEIGMRQLYDLPSVEGAYKPRAGARTPMQWSPGKNLGFSIADSGKLYLPLDLSPDAPTVEAQQLNPNSLLNHVRRLIQLRKNEPSLAGYAEFVPVLAGSNTYPFIFVRAVDKDVVLAVFNPGEKAVSAGFTLNLSAKSMTLLAGDKLRISNHGGDYSLEMPGISYALYKLR
jgi:maltose alpha-D-glucosyltransferase/alpha-amylase